MMIAQWCAQRYGPEDMERADRVQEGLLVWLLHKPQMTSSKRTPAMMRKISSQHLMYLYNRSQAQKRGRDYVTISIDYDVHHETGHFVAHEAYGDKRAQTDYAVTKRMVWEAMPNDKCRMVANLKQSGMTHWEIRDETGICHDLISGYLCGVRELIETGEWDGRTSGQNRSRDRKRWRLMHEAEQLRIEKKAWYDRNRDRLRKQRQKRRKKR